MSVALLLLARPELVDDPPSNYITYVTDELSVECQCRGIPRPNANWNFSTSVFKRQNLPNPPSTSKCGNIKHSAQAVRWSANDVNQRKAADGAALNCQCSDDATDVVEKEMVLTVQCK